MKLVYYNNLDFLRFIAVFLVIFQHWLVHDSSIDIGGAGVTIFFVLSGFLITKILLKDKEEVLKGKASLKKVFYNFYVRRSLRIFPIYFLILAFLYAFNHPIARDNIFYFLTYTSNVKTYIDQSWLGTLGPLWSLAVEEQFYFIWPLLILLTSKKNLKKLFIICLISGPIFRLIFMAIAVLLYDNVDLKISSMVMMPSNIDLFAIGGVLAYNEFYKTDLFKLPSKLVLLVSVILYALIMFFYGSIFYNMLYVLIIGVWSYYLISVLINDKINKLDSIFQFQPFSFLGRISYGLYLYHGPFFFIYAIVSFTENKLFGNHLFFEGYQNTNEFLFIKNVGYLILFSTISWFFIEKPANKFKKYFK